MTTRTPDEMNFLSLHALLTQVMAFATDNRYQTPLPTQEKLLTFNNDMQQLFMLHERFKLLPDHATKASLQQLSCLYLSTQNGLLDLLYSCPQPIDAEHWFDYQQEYRARTQQMSHLSQLLLWQQQFYQQVLRLFPQLPIPLSLNDTAAPDIVPSQEQPDADDQSPGKTILPDIML
ncbi:hypothetical protein ORJ04_03495 [Rheinheimera baltica]|uniref:Uncharacterized protein n=1 Tax=Rheinheimera baltica TaxID=67576 RepID=A0ABT9HV69_9GAMM|nr:hypothetical protein [Rheinheimera baltica]MDP5135011.1 hypothetical protein [Rheinheimera baltica]